MTMLLDTPNQAANRRSNGFRAAAAGRMLKICHVSLTLKTGGLERLLADFARLHDRSRVSMDFVAINEVGRFGDEIRQAGATVHQLKPTGKLGQIKQLAKLFRAGRYDVVHAHNTYPHIYASLAARWARVPVVVSTRHGQRLGHDWKAHLKYRLATLAVDRVIAVSNDAAQLSIEDDGLSAYKVEAIWNGIDLEQFPYRGPAAEPTAISVARLSAEKDFPTLLRAAQKVKAAVPDFKLLLVGDGPERGHLEQLANELELGSCVQFLGERKDVPELLEQAGFFVSSSLSEGISLTLLEAMASGLPVVATAVGGNPEVVTARETGFLATAGDVNSIANNMIDMCRSKERWVELGKAGRERVSKHFEIRRMIADYEDLYFELLKAKQR